MTEFFRYFKENMDGLNLPCPESLFSSIPVAIGTISIFLKHMDQFGRAVTVMEVAGAASRLEQLGFAGTLYAAYYTGAAIGSLAVATGRTISGGMSLSDVLMTMNRHHLRRDWLVTMFNSTPGLYKSVHGRQQIKYRTHPQ